MASTSSEGATRWGTSVQLTERGVNAAAKFWKLGNLQRALTPQERIQNAQRASSSKVVSAVEVKCLQFNLTNLLLRLARKTKCLPGGGGRGGKQIWSIVETTPKKYY